MDTWYTQFFKQAFAFYHGQMKTKQENDLQEKYKSNTNKLEVRNLFENRFVGAY